MGFVFKAMECFGNNQHQNFLQKIDMVNQHNSINVHASQIGIVNIFFLIGLTFMHKETKFFGFNVNICGLVSFKRENHEGSKAAFSAPPMKKKELEERRTYKLKHFSTSYKRH